MMRIAEIETKVVGALMGIGEATEIEGVKTVEGEEGKLVVVTTTGERFILTIETLR